MSDKRAEGNSPTEKSSSVAVEIARAIPRLSVIALAIIGLIMFHTEISQLFSRVTKLNLGPLTLETVAEKLKNLKLLSNTGPTERMSPEQISYLTKRFNEAASDLPYVNILWVDDKPINNRSVVDIFETMGFHVYIAQSYADAIKVYDERLINVVISDYNEADDPAQNEAQDNNKEDFHVGALVAEYVGKNCQARTIIFSKPLANNPRPPSYTFRNAKNFYDLLDATADLIGKPIPSECR